MPSGFRKGAGGSAKEVKGETPHPSRGVVTKDGRANPRGGTQGEQMSERDFAERVYRDQRR